MPADSETGVAAPDPPGHCPLCLAVTIQAYAKDRRRQYLQCTTCDLVYVAAADHLSAAAEKAEYDLHRNDPTDLCYRNFLRRLFAPLNARLPASSNGLDFGCGPGPTLSRMFEEAGHQVVLYDPFYADQPAVLTRRYDFITASEVVEHLRAPGPQLGRLFALLRPGGYLGLMTQMLIDKQAFQRWRYKDDPTHVCFYSRTSLAWLGGHLGAALEFVGRDVVLLRKPD